MICTPTGVMSQPKLRIPADSRFYADSPRLLGTPPPLRPSKTLFGRRETKSELLLSVFIEKKDVFSFSAYLQVDHVILNTINGSQYVGETVDLFSQT